MMEPSNYEVPPPTMWECFERWTCELFSEEWGTNARLNGRKGQPQNGVDVYGEPKSNIGWCGIQCKKKDNLASNTLTVSELRIEVDKAKGFDPKLSHFIIATTGPRDEKVQTEARQISDDNKKKGYFSVDVIFWPDFLILYCKHKEVFLRHYANLIGNIYDNFALLDKTEGGASIPLSLIEPPKVFIDSTREDLSDFLHAATEVANQSGFLPINFELFPADTNPQLKECMKKVKQCDLLIVIVAYKYGFVPPAQVNGEKKSITWLKWEAAKSEGLDTLAFLVDEQSPWSQNLMEQHRLHIEMQNGNADVELFKEVNEKITLLKKFKTLLRNSGNVIYIRGIDDFKYKLSTSLLNWKLENRQVKIETPEDFRTSQLPPYLDTKFEFAQNWIIRLQENLSQLDKMQSREIFRIADVFGDPLQLAKYYIEPDCQQYNPSDDLEDDVVREPAFRRLERFLSGSKKQNQLFILSDAGMGKTSFLVMIQLSYLCNFWPNGLESILLKLEPDTLDTLKTIEERSKKILLLDALDEDSSAWGRIKERIGKILKETRTFRRVIITCRTQYFSAGKEPFNRKGQVEVAGFLCPVVFMSLFSERQIEEFLNRRFPSEYGYVNPNVNRAKEIVMKMGALSMRPMLLAHIDDLIETEKSSWDEYTIYNALVRAWLLREQRKMLEGARGSSEKELWLACREVAVKLHKSGNRVISLDELNELLKIIPEVEHVKVMEVGGRSLLNKNSDGDYRFSHMSVQEFLIADGVIRGFLDSSIGLLRPTDQILSFIRCWLLASTLQQRSKLSLGLFNLSNFDLRGWALNDINLKETNLEGVNFDGANLRRTEMQKAFLVEASLNNTDFREAKLVEANLERAIIEGTNFSFANLKGAILRDVDLSFSELSSAILTHADLTDSVLSALDLTSVYLEGANLSNTKLNDVNLHNVNLINANLQGAQLENVDLSNADLNGARLQGAEFRNVSFKGTNLSRVKLRRANLQKLCLELAILDNANLRDSNLFKANLVGCQMKNTNLLGANLREANLNGADMSNAILEGADLSSADLKSTNLTGTSFQKANLEGVKLGKSRLMKTNLRKANLKEVDFRELNLDGIDMERSILENANLAGVSFRKANLKAAKLEGANIINANFESAILEGADLSSEKSSQKKTKVEGTIFRNANMSKARLGWLNLDGLGFKEVNLTGAFLKDASARYSDFRKAILSNANLTGVDFTGAKFDGAIIKRAKFQNAILVEVELRNLDFTLANLKYAILKGVDFSGMNLVGISLEGVDMSEADIRGTNLHKCCLIKAKLKKAKLEGADLTKADLTGADLQETQLRKANFKGAILSEAKLASLDLSGLNLKGFSLKNADLFKVNLENCDLSGADLSNANLKNAIIIGADFKDTNLEGSDISGIHFKQGDFRGAILKKVSANRLDLRDCDLSDLTFEGADLRKANFRGSKVSNTNFNEANLEEADFFETNLREASIQNVRLKEAKLSQLDLSELELENCRFDAADMREINLEGTKMKNCSFINSNLNQGKLCDSILKDNKLDRANLFNADLTNANLENASLEGADLQNAILRGVNLQNANLNGARLEGADLREANIENADYKTASSNTKTKWPKD